MRLAILTVNYMRRISPIFVALLPACVLIPVILGHQQFAFRDILQFYVPLWEYLAHQSSESLFPLWSPLDHFGVSIAGETTSGLFYPGRVVLLLGLPVNCAAALYILLHLGIASMGAYRLARLNHANTILALLPAVLYPYSGCVYFLHTNPPFLVGAAWLPWILAAATVLQRTRSGKSVAHLSLAMAMCVLGGDPQTVIHFLIAWFVFQLWLVSTQRWFSSRKSESERWRFWLDLRLIVGASVLSLVVSAPQVLASIDWTQQSWRNHSGIVSVWETLIYQVKSPTSDLRSTSWQKPPYATHAASVYDFSVAPWHLPELITPYISGKIAGENTRWSDALFGKSRVWTPTLYCGFIGALCMLVSLFQRQYWSKWYAMACCAMLLSMGSYGLVYCLRAVGLWMGWNWEPNGPDAAGGPYWWLVSLVPGYGQFRFPCKWLPWVAVGITQHLIHVLEHPDYQLRQSACGRWCMAVIAASTIGMAMTFSGKFGALLFAVAQSDTSADRFWGLLDNSAAIAGIRLSLMHTILIASATAFTLHRPNYRSWLIGLCIIEMTCLASWQTYTNHSTRIASRIDVALDPTSPPARFLVKAGDPEWPELWQEASAGHKRIDLVAQAQRQTWFTRGNLASGVQVINDHVTLPTRNSVLLLDSIKHLSPQQLEKVSNYFGVQAIATRVSTDDATSSILEVNELSTTSHLLRWSATCRVTGPDDNWSTSGYFSDLVTRISEAADIPAPNIDLPSSSSLPLDSDASLLTKGDPPQIELMAYSPERVHVRVTGSEGGWLTALWYQDGNWKGYLKQVNEYDWTAVPIYRTDGVFQAIELPAGDLEVYFEYTPWWWTPGRIASVIGCLMVGVLVVAKPLRQ